LTAPLYVASQTKQEKTKVIAALVERVRRDSPGGGGFIKRDLSAGLWYEIGNDKARDKVGHAIRRVIDETSRKKRKGPIAKADASYQSQRPKGAEEKPPLFAESGNTHLHKNQTVNAAQWAPFEMDPLPLMDTNLSAMLPPHQPNLAFGNVQGLGIPNMNLPLNNLLQFDGLMQQNIDTHQSIPSSAFIGGISGRLDGPNFGPQANLLTFTPSHSAFSFNQTKQLRQQPGILSANLNKGIIQNTFNFPIPNIQKTFSSTDGIQPSAIPNQPWLSSMVDPTAAALPPLDDAGLDELFSTDNTNTQASGSMGAQPQDPYKSGSDNKGDMF
jgi:hypothetical protein